MFSQIGQFLIETVFGSFVFLLLLRFYMQRLRAPFRNPVGEFVTVLTNWIVLPARRVIPGMFGLDLATLLLAWLAEALSWVLVLWVKGMALSGTAGIATGAIAALAAVELLRLSLYLLVGVVLVQVVLSCVNPYTPLAPVFDALTRPFYRPFRRFIPPIGSIDIVPLVVLVVAQVLLIAVGTLSQSVSRFF
ncbi:MAG: YggT family protein [Betaproteobacteria bacterium]|nr:YggT family protein [Betaproteobacteria bacterium]